MMIQIIAIRKDLDLSLNDLATHASNASNKYFTNLIKKNTKEEAVNGYTAFTKSPEGAKFLCHYDCPDLEKLAKKAYERDEEVFYADEKKKFSGLSYIYAKKRSKYVTEFEHDNSIVKNWISEYNAKYICYAKDENDLLKIKTYCKNEGLVEDEDYFLDYDKDLLVAIGIKPLPEKVAERIAKHYKEI